MASINRGTTLAIIGGQDNDNAYVKSIDILECRNDICGWTRTNQELSLPRNYPVALGVPASVAHCN